MPYDRGCYTDVAPFWGDRLWAFLGETRILIVMLKAVKAGGSPAEAVEKELIRRFGNAVKEKRVREFAGYLIWQVLEAHLARTRGQEPQPAGPSTNPRGGRHACEDTSR